MQKQNFDIYTFLIDKTDFNIIQNNIKNLEEYKYDGVILEIQDNDFAVSNLPILIELFSQKQLVVIGIKTEINEVLEFAKFSNLAIFNDEVNNINKPKLDATTSAFINKPRIIRTDIKISEQIYTKNTSLIILKDVAAKAEVLSDKSIYIYGGAYGKIFAGINDKNAIIFINFFAAKLVCINGVYREFDKTPKEYLNKAVQISLKDNKLDFKILE